MPRIINQDTIARIGELAGRGYSNSATARELNLDRATVRKYRPKEKEESEVAEKPEVKLSIEDELNIMTTRNELNWDISETLSKIENRQWETTGLGKKGQLATEGLRYLKGKVQKAATLDELESLASLVSRKRDELEPILEEDVKLEGERQKREEEEWQEGAAKRRKDRETLWAHYTFILPWYIPCRKFTEDVLGTFLINYGDGWAGVLASQLALVNELEWADDIGELELLFHEFLNIIIGYPREKNKIIDVMQQRIRRILTARDEDATEAFTEWLNCGKDEEFVEGALKLAGIFKRLAEERYIDIGELLKQETPLPEVPVKDKKAKAGKARQTPA